MERNELFKVAFNIHEYADTQDPNELERLSYLGTPILFPIKLLGGNYLLYNSKGEMILKSYNDFELPLSTLVTLRRAKIIKETKTVGGTSTIKESYGFTDWSIDIKGICMTSPDHKSAKNAFTQHVELLKWEQIVDSIGVEGVLFSVKGIRNLVIKDIGFSQIEGRPDIIPFTISAVSDEPLELLLP